MKALSLWQPWASLIALGLKHYETRSWYTSHRGDVVFDPFGGIASTCFEALKLGRKFVGAELKPEYHALGVKHLQEAEALANAPDMFMYMERLEMEAALKA